MTHPTTPIVPRRDRAGAALTSTNKRRGCSPNTFSRAYAVAFALAPLAAGCFVGCQAPSTAQTDRDVYGLIRSTQSMAIGITSNARLENSSGNTDASDRMYDFNPNPIKPDLPPAFDSVENDATRPEPPDDADDAGDEDESEAAEEADDEKTTPDIFTAEQMNDVLVMNLQAAMARATSHGRSLQDAKEDLYLAALDLTLERHLWTPQFVASVRTDIDNFEEAATLDRALTTVSEAAVSQRLAFGGDITVRVLHSLVREVSDHVARGESGTLIIEGRLPLLRGAGRIAYETRYRAERELIYAVRSYERFRRSFLVDIARDYFNLQRLKTAIGNTYKSYVSREESWKKADFIHRVGQSRDIAQAPRAKANFRDAEADLVRSKERYESALDRFKIRLGMSVDTLLDVVDQDSDDTAGAVDDLLADVTVAEAVATAQLLRLDLLNNADRVDDVRRGVVNARNRILPDLDLSGSMTSNSDPTQSRPATIRDERTAWRGGIELRIDDRKTERNAYRAATIAVRRAERDHDEFVDNVRADVRRAMREIAQQVNLQLIQEHNVAENDSRLQGALAQFNLGQSTNQDVVDAETNLLRARNDLASAVASYRNAILEFRRDTGTLRVTDDGRFGFDDPFAQDAARDADGG